jgi:hypothetical protein
MKQPELRIESLTRVRRGQTQRVAQIPEQKQESARPYRFALLSRRSPMRERRFVHYADRSNSLHNRIGIFDY